MKPAVANPSTRVICLRIVPLAGQTVYLTGHPRDLTMSNGRLYKSAAGYDFTGYSADNSMSPESLTNGIAGLAGIGYDEIASGVSIRPGLPYSRPRGIRQSKTRSRSFQYAPGKTTLLDGRYRIEENGTHRCPQSIRRQDHSAACPKVFGGSEFAGCKIALGPITKPAPLTAVTSNTVFRDSGRIEAADWFVGGIAGLHRRRQCRTQTDRNQTPRIRWDVRGLRVIPLSRGGWGRLR